MPGYTVHKDINVDLHLTEKEAHWLKAYLQNTCHPGGLNGEPTQDTAMRCSIFSDLKDALEEK